MREWVDNWIAAKLMPFFRHSVAMSLERFEKVIVNDGCNVYCINFFNKCLFEAKKLSKYMQAFYHGMDIHVEFYNITGYLSEIEHMVNKMDLRDIRVLLGLYIFSFSFPLYVYACVDGKSLKEIYTAKY